MIYICKSCDQVFREPKDYWHIERFGDWDHKMCDELCPFCGSDNLRRIRADFYEPEPEDEDGYDD